MANILNLFKRQETNNDLKKFFNETKEIKIYYNRLVELKRKKNLDNELKNFQKLFIILQHNLIRVNSRYLKDLSNKYNNSEPFSNMYLSVNNSIKSLNNFLNNLNKINENFKEFKILSAEIDQILNYLKDFFVNKEKFEKELEINKILNEIKFIKLFKNWEDAKKEISKFGKEWHLISQKELEKIILIIEQDNNLHQFFKKKKNIKGVVFWCSDEIENTNEITGEKRNTKAVSYFLTNNQFIVSDKREIKNFIAIRKI